MISQSSKNGVCWKRRGPTTPSRQQLKVRKLKLFLYDKNVRNKYVIKALEFDISDSTRIGHYLDQISLPGSVMFYEVTKLSCWMKHQSLTDDCYSDQGIYI